MRLEDTFGSLGAVQTAISSDGTGMVFTPAMKLVSCGLLHEHDGAGAPLGDPERLADLIDPVRFQEAVTAAGKALAAAFPAAAQDAAQTAVAAAPGSPGPSGTTSAPSRSGAPTPSSG